ncbi:MAG: polyhydroxyalkanoate synthesis repressor PhaR [Pseudomonadota bacterium]
MSQSKSDGPVIIKKYANRRLYDTSASRYVTLDHLRELVRDDTDFKVVDAKSGEDLTRSVLAQIIFEEESKGTNLLPVEFLRQLIGFYGDSMQAFVPGYLRMSMDGLTKQQDELRSRMTEAMGSPPGSMAMMEEQAKRNMAMFEQAMRMFSPFAQGEAGEKAAAAGAGAEPRSDDVASLRAELEAMRAKLDKLADG